MSAFCQMSGSHWLLISSRNIAKHYKAPQRMTDMCEICVDGKRAERRLASEAAVGLSADERERLTIVTETYKDHRARKEERHAAFSKAVSERDASGQLSRKHRKKYIYRIHTDGWLEL